jgi:hypothetical protein
MDTGENQNIIEPVKSSVEKKEQRNKRLTIIGVIVFVVILLGLLITGLVFLINPNLTSEGTVARVRDIFIILMALESILVGLVLVILIVQIARLTNLLENEVKPILQSTNETVSTLRGTTKFISDNLVEPIIKFNETVAIFRRATDIIKIARKK